MQMLGFIITDYAEEGLLGDLTPVASKEGWDKLVPAPLQKFDKYKGHWVAAPVNIHRTNWIWANKKIFDELKITPPKTFDELLVAADKIKKAGYIPLGPRRSAVAGRHHLRQRSAVRRRSRVLPQGASSSSDPRRDGQQDHGEGVRADAEAARSGRPELPRPRLEPGHRDGHQRQGRHADHGRLGQGRVPERGQEAQRGLPLLPVSRAPKACSPSTPTPSPCSR